MAENLDSAGKLCYHLCVKGCDEDTRKGKIPREEAALVKGFRIPAFCDTTSEPWGRNVPPGTPVKASMSDGKMP